MLRVAERLTLATSGVVCLGLLVASPWLAGEVYGDERLLPLFIIFALALPGAAVLRVSAAATRVSQDLRASVVIEDFGRPFLFAVIAVFLLWRGMGVLGAAIAVSLSFLLMAFPARVWARKWFPHTPDGRPKGEPIASARTLVRYSVPMALAGTVGVTMTWFDRLLVGFYLPIEAAGWYQVAAQASGAFAVVVGAFNAIFTPMIAGLLVRGERERLEELFRVATKWGALAVLPGAALCLAAPEAALGSIWGADYLPAAAPLVILTCGQLVTVGTGAVGYLLMMSGHPNLWLGLSLGALGADVLLNVLLIPRYGLVGAAAATAMSVAVLFIGGLIVVRRRLGIWPWDRRFLGVVATGVGVLVAAFLLREWTALGQTGTVLAVVGLAAGLTLVGWRLMASGPEDRLILRKLSRLGR